MILAALVLGVASLIASGVLFAHQRCLTYLAAAGALWEAQWLLLTLLDRTVASAFSPLINFRGGALLLLLIWIVMIRHWRRPVFVLPREMPALIVTLIVLAAALPIVNVNGFQDGDFVTHGFYNGDTMTFISLVQRAQLTRGLTLSNPFAGGEALEYPTLLHAAAASLLAGFGLDMSWLHLLPFMTFRQIVFTVPLLFLLWDIVWPEPKSAWQSWLGVPSRTALYLVQALLVLYMLSLTWDGYVYPQSHFFLTGLWLLLLALLARGWGEGGYREYLYVVPAGIVTLVLMLANAVTGTAALAVAVVFCGLRAASRLRPVWQRALFLTGAFVLIVLFVFLPPGDSSFGRPGFSYTAAASMMALAPLLVALVISVWLSEERHLFITAATAVLIMMSFFTFIFSTRDIVVENAGRFIYHAGLVGFPLLLPPLIRLFYFLRRQLLYTTATLPQQTATWVSVGSLILLGLLPAAASLVSTYDHLLFQDQQIVSAEYQESLAWLRANTPPTAIIAASPYAPWAVPEFTGRSLLRIDHWLSPNDELLRTMEQAWQGERQAQEKVLQAADFLLLTQDEQRNWRESESDAVFRNEHVSIYQL